MSKKNNQTSTEKEIPQDFVIQWITNNKELEANHKLVEDFFKLYEDPSNFPQEDERENPEYIKGRIAKGSLKPKTHLMALSLINPKGNIFVGGSIIEFYPQSSCVLITYVFVKKEYRGTLIGEENKKIGELLLKNNRKDGKHDGLPGLISQHIET